MALPKAEGLGIKTGKSDGISKRGKRSSSSISGNGETWTRKERVSSSEKRPPPRGGEFGFQQRRHISREGRGES